MDEILLYWRPGCGWCTLLRHDLHHAGLPVREINIWADTDAAAVLRGLARGHETVPTVAICDVALVNPRIRRVLKEVNQHAPNLLEHARIDTATSSGPTGYRAGLLASSGLALGWLVLAFARPDTTFHLAPLIARLAWPVVTRWRRTTALGWGTATRAASGGSLVAFAAALLMTAGHALRGPTLTESGNPTVEVFVAIAVGASLGTVLGATRLATPSSRGRGERQAACCE